MLAPQVSSVVWKRVRADGDSLDVVNPYGPGCSSWEGSGLMAFSQGYAPVVPSAPSLSLSSSPPLVLALIGLEL